MNYQLLYDDQVVADVTAEDSDFPTFFGKDTLTEDLEQKPELSHLLSYIDYSVRTWPLIEAERTDEIDYNEEAKFTDLIESERWWLVDQAGKKTGILIPVFCTENGINWRLDPAR